MIRNILVVALGGAIGSVARYLAQKSIYEWHPHSFPFGTFFVNIFGCLLIGCFYGLAEKGNVLTPEWRLFLATGLCGGFTTFSSFAMENIVLVKSGNYLYVAVYIAASVFLGILAAFCGSALVKL